MKSSGFASDFNIRMIKRLCSLPAEPHKLPHPASSHLLPLTQAKDNIILIFFVNYHLESMKSSGFASDFNIRMIKRLCSLPAEPHKLPHPSLRDTFSQNKVLGEG